MIAFENVRNLKNRAELLTIQNKTAHSKAGKYPTYHFSLFNCCLSVVLQLEKRAYP